MSGFDDSVEPDKQLRDVYYLNSTACCIINECAYAMGHGSIRTGKSGLVWALLYYARYQHLTGNVGAAKIMLEDAYHSANEELDRIPLNKGTLIAGRAGPMLICISASIVLGDVDKAKLHCEALLSCPEVG